MVGLKDLLETAEFDAIARELFSESDRAAVVVAAAYADAMLREHIDRFLLPAREKRHLGLPHSETERLALAYRLGLIRKGMYETFREVYKLRNKFAHNTSSANLDDPGIAQLVDRIIGQQGYEPKGDLLTVANKYAAESMSTAQVNVRIVVVALTAILRLTLERRKQLEVDFTAGWVRPPTGFTGSYD